MRRSPHKTIRAASELLVVCGLLVAALYNPMLLGFVVLTLGRYLRNRSKRE